MRTSGTPPPSDIIEANLQVADGPRGPLDPANEMPPAWYGRQDLDGLRFCCEITWPAALVPRALRRAHRACFRDGLLWLLAYVDEPPDGEPPPDLSAEVERFLRCEACDEMITVCTLLGSHGSDPR